MALVLARQGEEAPDLLKREKIAEAEFSNASHSRYGEAYKVMRIWAWHMDLRVWR